MNRVHLRRCLFLCASLAASAFAQTETPAKPEAPATLPAVTVSGSQERKADEVVERRSRGSALFGDADLREVPFTVNVITSQEIANKQAKTIGEALAGDPAVRNDYGGTGAYPTESFNIRGFSINSNGIFKDGMPMANQVTQALENIDQVEVIRGPMGFRYGFVPPGGSINLVSKRPTSAPLRSVTFKTDEYGSAQLHGDFGGRLGGSSGDDDAFGYRVNAAGGETKNFVRPVDIRRGLLAGSFDWRATRDTTFTIALDTYRWRSSNENFHYTVPDVNGNEIRGIPRDNYFGQLAFPGNDFRTSTGSIGVESKLTDKLKLESQFAVYDWKAAYSLTNPFNAQPNGDFQMTVFKGGYKSRNYANTSFLNWQIDGLGLRHSLTAGLSIAKFNGYNQQNAIGGTLGTPDGLGGTIPFVNNFFAPRQFPDTTGSPSGPYVRTGDSWERGQFVSDMIRIGTAWRVLLAARHSSIDDRGIYSPSKNSSTDPTVGLMWDVLPSVSLYASHATGLEKGGVPPAGTTNAFVPLPPQKTKQIELGAKSDLAEDLTLDASLFRIEKAAEFTDTSAGPCPCPYVQSGRQVHTGGEVRLIGRVLPAVTVTGGVQYLQAKLTGNPETAGQRPFNVPKLNVSASGDWRIDAVPGLTLTSALYRVGEREISVPNIAAKAPAYTRIDLGGRYETTLGGQTVIGRLNVENVTDRTYYNSGWYALYEYGAPRALSASVEVKF